VDVREFRQFRDAQFTGVLRYRRLRSPANLPAAPTLKHPEQEEFEGGVPVTVLEDASLDFRARACNNWLGVRSGRRTGVRRADSGARRSHAGGYEHDGEDHSGAKEPHLLASTSVRMSPLKQAHHRQGFDTDHN
jgi:hypothetical protein